MRLHVFYSCAVIRYTARAALMCTHFTRNSFRSMPGAVASVAPSVHMRAGSVYCFDLILCASFPKAHHHSLMLF